MKILAIGNSFSQDATRYLRGVAAAAGECFKVVNLYIGGCSLERHHANAAADARAYSIEFGGETTGFFTTLHEALCSDSWDVVTLQQASPLSVNFQTYCPHLDYMAAYVRTHAPTAKLYIHQTWGYESGSQMAASLGYRTCEEMFADVRAAYAQAAEAVLADGIIPSGEVITALAGEGFAMQRDTFHLSLGIGRYAAALTWFRTLCGKEVTGNAFAHFDVAVSAQEMAAAQRAVDALVG